MQDSDDYFDDDDFVLDENTLAVLEREESKLTHTQISPAQPGQPISRTDRPPPAKRQKIGHITAAAVFFNQQDSAEDYEDLPEISVQGDGSYGVASGGFSTNYAAGSQRTESPIPRTSQTQSRSITPIAVSPPVPRVPTQGKPVSTGQNYVRSIAGPSTSRPQAAHIQTTRKHSGSASIAHARVQSNGLQRLPSTPDVFGLGSQGALRASQGPLGSQVAKGADQMLKTEISILRAQLEEFKSHRDEMERKLREAQDVKYAKEGEVSILRASIEKTAQRHAMEVANLKAATQMAEAAKAQLHKEVKEEIERLRTQYTFRQHELETSSRKTPFSVHSSTSKRNGRAAPPTPVKTPAEMRGWAEGKSGIVAKGIGSGFAGPAGFASAANPASLQTPRRPRFGMDPPNWPALKFEAGHKSTSTETLSQGPAKRLPGFHNSFMASTPTRLSQRIDNHKGKERAEIPDLFSSQRDAGSSPLSSPIRAPPIRRQDIATLARAREVVHEHNTSDIPMEDGAPSSSGEALDDLDIGQGDVVEDIGMDEFDEAMGAGNEEIDEVAGGIESPDWRDELHRIILTHALPSLVLPTLQLILNASVPPDRQQEYTGLCTRLLENLGVPALLGTTGWITHVQLVSDTLVQISAVLSAVRCVTPLCALFHLIRTACCAVPSFTASLYSAQPKPDSDEVDAMPPPILAVLSDTIRSYLRKDKEKIKDDPFTDDILGLAHEITALLEGLAWGVPEDAISKLAFIIRGHKILPTLLSPALPMGQICHSVRALTVFATRSNLSRHLLSFPYPEQPVSENQTPIRDHGKLPHIEQLSFYLSDFSRKDEHADRLRQAILVFTATLAISHPDAIGIILQSETMVSSIIVYLYHTCAPLWEADEALVEHPCKADPIAQSIVRTLSLLYYLVFTPSPPHDLRYRLHHSPQRVFSGIAHMFTVTMGRLCFADPLDWLGEESSQLLEGTIGLALELLRLDMDGPELDMIWSAFQIDEEQQRIQEQQDEEEKEAQLAHIVSTGVR